MQPRRELEHLIHAHAACVRRVLSQRGVRPADLADAEQEVFIVAHRKLPELEVRSSLLGWLLGIAVKVASQHRRKASYRREHIGFSAEPVSESLDPLAHLQAAERQARVHRWLEALSPEQRAVVVLHELSELSMHEVADALGVPLKTAFSRLYAAHRALRRVAAREQLERPRRGIGAVLAGLMLGFKQLPRAQAALLPVPLAALLLTAAQSAAPSPLALTASSTEHASQERRAPRSALSAAVPLETEAAVSSSARPRPPHPRAAHAVPAHARDTTPDPSLIVLRVEQDFALARLPYPHPFEERAFTTVDPTTVKPRIVRSARAACAGVHSPCAP